MNLRDILVATAQRVPDRTALVLEERRVTYREFDELSNRVAHVLLRAGLRRGGHVALLMSYRPEWLVGYFGIIKAGGKAIVLNSMLKLADYDNLLRDSDSAVLLTEHSFAESLDGVLSSLPALQRTLVWDGGEFQQMLADAPATMPGIALDAADECTIIYTSGVLGRQKGVIHTHESLIVAARLVTSGHEQTGNDVVVGLIPFFYLLGLAAVALVSVCEGSTVVLMPRFTTRGLLELVDRERVTMLIGVPAMFNALAQEDGETIAQYDVSSLRIATTAGAKSSPDLMAKLEEKYGLTACEIYGTTEAVGTTMSDCRSRKLGTIGRPIQEYRIIDGEGNDVRAGETGELVVRSPQLMKGYYNAPDLTAQVLKDGWFYTGDLVCEDEEGYLQYVEKLSFLIVTSAGTKIPPTEVEDILLEHPAVAAAAFVGVDGPDGNQIPTLFVVPRAGVKLTKLELREYCSANLADYKIPRHIEFIEALPTTGSGKIDRRALKERRVMFAAR